MASNYSNKLAVAAIFLLPLLAACDKAVKINDEVVSYVVKGDRHSVLYPFLVQQSGEDVRIQLQEAVPMPEILSIDTSGHAVAFNFTMEGNKLIVPGKFDHLQLRRAGAATIDIFSQISVRK